MIVMKGRVENVRVVKDAKRNEEQKRRTKTRFIAKRYGDA